MHHDTHGHDSGAEAAGAASVGAVEYDDVCTGDGNNPAIDVNVDDNQQGGGQEPQPQQKP